MPGPRIAIDAHAIGTRAGGNETYMRTLLGALAAHAPEAEWRALGQPEALAAAGIDPARTVPLTARNAYMRMALELPWRARSISAQVLHVQYTRPLWIPCPYIVSMHDLVGLHLPASLPRATRWRLRHFSGTTARRAAGIFVLTRAIQREIMDAYHIAAERFHLIQPALDTERFHPCDTPGALEAMRARYGLPSEYVLYLGLLHPRKNVGRLARAMARLPQHGHDLPLVVAGPRAWLVDTVLREVEDAGLGARLRFTGYVNESDLPLLLAGARVFAYLSRYEGFGIPAVEALACGAPVLAADIPVLREATLEQAAYVDPLDDEAVLHGLLALLEDSEAPAHARAASVRLGEHYTSARMAQAALAGYEAAAGGG